MLLVLGLTACNSDYKPDVCTFVDRDEVLCVPTDRAKKEYILKASTGDMLGYACFSEDDFSEGKKRARQIIENLGN